MFIQNIQCPVHVHFSTVRARRKVFPGKSMPGPWKGGSDRLSDLGPKADFIPGVELWTCFLSLQSYSMGQRSILICSTRVRGLGEGLWPCFPGEFSGGGTALFPWYQHGNKLSGPYTTKVRAVCVYSVKSQTHFLWGFGPAEVAPYFWSQGAVRVRSLSSTGTLESSPKSVAVVFCQKKAEFPSRSGVRCGNE